MNPRHKILIVASACVLLFFILVDLKNYLSYGAPFVISEDIFDHLKFYLNLPGMVIGFLVVMVVYQNIHNYNFYVMETVSLLASSVFYGMVLSLIVAKVRSGRSASTPNSTGG